VQAIQPSDVVSFLERNFVNANAALAVAGGVREEDLRRSLAKLVARDRVGSPARGSGARRGRGGKLDIRGGPRGQGQVVRYLEGDPSPANLLALAVALDLVGADPDSMLFQAVRERHGLGYDVAADLEWGNRWAVAVLSASAHPGQAARLVRAIDEVVARAAAD